jgi:hypothetical protein
MEGTRKRVKLRERWRDEVEYNRNKKNTGREWPETVGSGERFYCKTKSTKGITVVKKKKKDGSKR